MNFYELDYTPQKDTYYKIEAKHSNYPSVFARTYIPNDVDIEYEIEDEFGNIFSDTIQFVVDKTIPEGKLELIEGKKVGVNYVANVAFTGVDAGKIIAYGHNIDNPNNLRGSQSFENVLYDICARA